MDIDKEQWLRKINGTNKERREQVLWATKNGVSVLGRELSLLLIGFIFDVSCHDDKEMEKILLGLGLALDAKMSTRQDCEQLLVFDRVFAIANTLERQLRDRDETLRLRNKAPFVPRPATQFSGLQDFIITIIGRLCKLVQILEDLCWSVMNEEVSVRVVNQRIKNCSAELNGINMDIVEGYEKLDIWTQSDFDDPIVELLEAKIKELWDQFEF